MTVDQFALGRHRDSFGTIDVLVTPSASQGLAHTALGALKTLPIAMKTVSQYIKDFAKGEIPDFVFAAHTQGPHVLVFVCACPPQRFRLGLHVQVQQLLNDVVDHADQFLSFIAEHPVVVSPHHATQRVLIVMLPTWQCAPTAQEPPHLLGGCTEST